VSDVALDRFLREEQTVADLAVCEALRDELKDFDLASGREVLRLLPSGAGGKLDHVRRRIAARRDRLEAAGVLAIPGQDFLTLSCVHEVAIGRL
jgi:hypothetical protein